MGACIVEGLVGVGALVLQHMAPLQVHFQLARADIEGLADIGIDTAHARGCRIDVRGVDRQDAAGASDAVDQVDVTQHVAGGDGIGRGALGDFVGALDLPGIHGHRSGGGRLQHDAHRVALGLFRLQVLVGAGDDRDRARAAVGADIGRRADGAAHRIAGVGEGGQATIAVLGRVGGAEAFGVAGTQSDPVGWGPLDAQLRRGLAFAAFVLVVTQRAGKFQLLQHRCRQFDVAGVDILRTVIGRIAQADDVTLVGVSLRGQAVAGLAPLGTDCQAQRTTFQVHQAARHGEVEHVQAGLGACADGRRDVVVQRLRVEVGIVANTPHAAGTVRVAQRALYSAVAQEPGALVHQIGTGVQVGGVVAPVTPVALDADQEAVELIGVVGHARADIPGRVAQARGLALDRIVGMGRRQHHGARAAAGIARAKGIAPAAGDAGRCVAEDRFLLRVADLGVDLAAFAEGEAGAAEHVDVLLFRREITELLRRIPQAALGRH